MAEPTIQLGNGNWAGKSDSLLGFSIQNGRFYEQEFTFSRSTTGTYTDKDGHIQEMPYNLALYSEEFNNAAYYLTESSITENAINSPIGTLTADKLIENTSNNLHRVGQGSISVISGEVYTFSFYVKAAERNELELQRINTSGTVFNSISVTTANLTNGTLSVGSNVTASSIEDVGDGWYRISISLTAIANGSGGFNIGMQKNGSVSYQGDGVSGVYLWGFQAVKGTSAKTYFPTTTRLNMPRVDYLNNSKGSLILEPQRTNLVRYSEDFSNAAWQVFRGSILTSTTISPEGIYNAYRYEENADNGQHFLRTQNISMTSGLQYTASVFVRAAELTLISLGSSNSSLWSASATFNLSNGLVTAGSGTIEPIGSNWYRCAVSGLCSTTSTNVGFEITTSSGVGSLGDGLDVYGAQLEAGSNPTTLINTSGSSVTRNADACSLTNVADRIGQTEGTIYGEFDFKDHSTGTRRLLCLTDGSSSNRITTYINTLDKLSVYIVNGGAAQADIQATVLTEGTIKYALAYANNSIKLYLNGTQVGTDTSATIPATSDFLVGFEHSGSSSYFNWKNCQIYSTALSDTELATLTT